MPFGFTKNSELKIIYNQMLIKENKKYFLEDELPLLRRTKKSTANKKVFNDSESKRLLIVLGLVGFCLELLGTAFVIEKDSIQGYEKTITGIGSTAIAGGALVHLLLLGLLIYKFSLCDRTTYLFFKPKIKYVSVEAVHSHTRENDTADPIDNSTGSDINEDQKNISSNNRNDIMEP